MIVGSRCYLFRFFLYSLCRVIITEKCSLSLLIQQLKKGSKVYPVSTKWFQETFLPQFTSLIVFFCLIFELFFNLVYWLISFRNGIALTHEVRLLLTWAVVIREWAIALIGQNCMLDLILHDVYWDLANFLVTLSVLDLLIMKNTYI